MRAVAVARFPESISAQDIHTLTKVATTWRRDDINLPPVNVQQTKQDKGWKYQEEVSAQLYETMVRD